MVAVAAVKPLSRRVSPHISARPEALGLVYKLMLQTGTFVGFEPLHSLSAFKP